MGLIVSPFVSQHIILYNLYNALRNESIPADSILCKCFAGFSCTIEAKKDHCDHLIQSYLPYRCGLSRASLDLNSSIDGEPPHPVPSLNVEKPFLPRNLQE